MEFVKKRTENICLEAVKENGLVLYYIKEQTPEICLAAIEQNKKSFVYVNICPNTTYEETKIDLENIIKREKEKSAIFERI